jgi:hypothetical protein
VVEERLAARRQPVPDEEALGEAEGLELADVGLEVFRLLTEGCRQIRRANRRAGSDQLEHGSRPRRVASAVEAIEAGTDRSELFGIEVGVLAECDAGIVTDVAKPDAVHRTLGP